MNPTPISAAGTDAPKGASSESNGSILSRRLSRLSGRRVPVAIALDFQSDGTCQRHACWSLPDDPTFIPPFHVDAVPNSVRVVFYHTPTAEQTQHADNVEGLPSLPGSLTSPSDKVRVIEHCPGCLPDDIHKSTSSPSSNGQVSANHVDKSSGSWTDEISPGASLAQPRSGSAR